MSFASPQLLWLVALAPAAGAAAAWLWRRRLAAGAAWASRGLWDRLLASYRPLRLALSVGLLAATVLAAAAALAQPRWGVIEEKVERKGVDIVFVLDSSLSMAAEDVGPPRSKGADGVDPSRLEVAKAMIRRLVQETPGNRVALVDAEGESVVMTPLTVDAAVLDLLLDGIAPGTLPTPGTELAPALDTALKLFPEGDGKFRVVVLLSDGEDHGSAVAEAISRLAEAGAVVHVIGLGSAEGATLPLPGGGPGEVKRDRAGQVVVSRLEEKELEQIARSTGGLYLRPTSSGFDPRPIADRIDAMEKRAIEGQVLSTRAERFQWPLAAAVACLLLYLATGSFAASRPGEEAA